eukprot:2213551-Ditylum_brightwellii.AAC.1
MTERRRRQNEEKRIQEAQDAAERLASHYLSSDEGKVMIRNTAEKRVLDIIAEKSKSNIKRKQKIAGGSQQLDKMGDSRDDHVLDTNIDATATLATRAHELQAK